MLRQSKMLSFVEQIQLPHQRVIKKAAQPEETCKVKSRKSK
jgi:hypothetical protein